MIASHRNADRPRRICDRVDTTVSLPDHHAGRWLLVRRWTIVGEAEFYSIYITTTKLYTVFGVTHVR